MTTISPVIPRTSFDRFRWALTDSWTVARSNLIYWLREPTTVAFGLAWPIMSVLLFGYVFGSAMSVAGGGDYREFLMPGMFGQAMVFGLSTTMITVCTAAAKGVTDRYRSLPMARSGVVGGRSIADMLNSCLDLVVLLLCGLVVGWRAHGTLAETVAAIGLLLLLRFALIWVGIYLGLLVKNPETANNLTVLLFPITMLANTFVLPSQMPAWLGVIADWNPLSATVAATRELFGNPGLGGDSWVAQHSLLMAIVWPLLLIVIFVPLSVRRYQRLSR
jgi:ABC-2 type transport system permease protein